MLVNKTNDSKTYTVKSGDTLYKIANIYGITVDELKNANNLTNNTLSIGQSLIIPDDSQLTYTVKKGDTLYGIAKLYNISVNELKSMNGLNNNTLSIGQNLIIKK